MEQQEMMKKMELKIKELEGKLYSMELDMMLMESRQNLYRLENINMNLSTQLMIKK